VQAKYFLRQAYRLDELISSNKKELNELNIMKTSIPGIDYSKDKVQVSSDSEAGYTKIINNIIKLEASIKDDTEHLIELKFKIRAVIKDVADNEERLLLQYRYLNFMHWDDICDKMGISPRTVHRIHSSALQHVRVPEVI